MNIGGRTIGSKEPPYVIAEIGVNHDGKVARALELTDAAAAVGADAIKLQWFETDRLLCKAAKLAAYQANAGERDPIEMLRRLELSADEMRLVVERAHELGIHAIVTVFSVELVDQAQTLEWDAYKSASPDIVHKPLLDRLALTGKPLIVSTGASTMEEVVRAVAWLDSAKDRLALLQCVSCYPTSPEDAAHDGIAALRERCHLPIGYSDHVSGPESARGAIEHGAVILEKHLTWSCNATGPDHAASLEPNAFGAYVIAARETRKNSQSIKASWKKRVLDCEHDVRLVSRQSVVSTIPIARGQTIEHKMLTIKRPGTGIEPWMFVRVIGERATRDIEIDIPITLDDVEGLQTTSAHTSGAVA